MAARRMTTVEFCVRWAAVTICVLVIETGTSWMIRGPSAVSDAARDYLKDIVSQMEAIVILYVGMKLQQHIDKRSRE